MLDFLKILILAALASVGQSQIRFTEDLANYEIPEGAAIGDYVGTLICVDVTDPTVTFSYTVSPTVSPSAYDYLSVDAVSGNVTVNAKLDYESNEVTIYIQNENDNWPEFQDESYSAEISEDTEIGGTVIEVRAEDDDGDDLTYTLHDGPDCEMDQFAVDPSSGEITVNAQLDYASVVQYTVCVNASDPGGLFDSTEVVISIRDAQNLPPVFVEQPYDRIIPENTPVGDPVLQVIANDGDSGVTPKNTIIYSLLVDANGTFSIDSNNGYIEVVKALDRDTDPITQLYTLTVQAKEDDATQPDNQTTSTTFVYIRLEDVDDNSPRFVPDGMVSATIPEHSPAGTQLDFGLEVFDLDSGSSGQIKLSLENDEDIFSLASDTVLNTGMVDVRVRNSSALDFERISEIEFQIRASDVIGMNSSTVRALVQLTNINDNTPLFTQEQYDVSLPENSQEGTFVTQIMAEDADADAILSYSLLGYNNDWFGIDPDTGNITVSSEADFNVELLSVYFLTCVVDDGERVSTALLNVTITDVNDNAPDFQSDLYEVSIPEYNVDDLEDDELEILQVLATDADLTPANRVLTYAIDSGNDAGKFDINSTTGVIYRQDSIDRETEDATYDLVVMATDNGIPPMTGTTQVIITIEDVNDNDPVFLGETYDAKVAENAESGTVVGNVTAADGDVDSLAVLYTIETASPFLINQEGIITLSGSLDYEIQNEYNLTITATDREDTSRMDSCQILIEILDVNDEGPVFLTPSPSSVSVNESAAYCYSLDVSSDCHILITLEASDADTKANLIFSITEVKGYDENNREVASDFSDQFGIESETGEIYVETELDRETIQRFDITVEVNDTNAEENVDAQIDSAELVITVLDINDNAPEFIDLPGSFTTPETDQIGMVISVNIRAEDKDAGNNGLVVYELTDDANGLIRIDENTGILSVAQPIDNEQYDSLSITICAKDLGDPSLNMTVTREIFISDVNDNTPVFNETLPSEASILENSTIGTFVLSVYATDADSVYGNLTYEITAGVGSSHFEIDPRNGDITVREELDREGQALYTLTVVATDGTRQDSLEVTITILDVNDNAPVFAQSFPEIIFISETAEPGSSVATIVATDADEPETNNSAVRYTMTNRNGTEFFRIDYETGVVTLDTTSTDTLIPGVYVLDVMAFDLGDPPMETGPRDFTVVVTDYNDEAPVFVQPQQGDRVFVDEDYTGYIITAEATDGDLGDNGVVTFLFDTGLGATDDYRYFTINNISGEINIISQTDRETQEVYILGIIGRNSLSDPVRESQVTFYVQVNDTDDNVPAYWGELTGPDGTMEPPEPQQLEVVENLGEGTFVGTVSPAVDLDSDLYNQIYYFIVGGNNDDYFSLDKVSRNLTLLNPIDREATPEFSLVVRADSNPDFVPNEEEIYDPLIDGSLARVTVLVSDVNDSPPRFELKRYTAGVLYSTAYGIDVINVRAVDPDVGDNAVIDYAITSQTSYDADGSINSGEVNVFAISAEGAVRNTLTFQDSTDSYYIVELLATDSLNGNFTDNATLSVYLMTETDQVSVIFADDPANVRATEDEFARLLEEIMIEEGGYSEVSVNIDSTDVVLDSSDNIVINRTEMLLHVVDDLTNTVISPNIVQNAIDFASGPYIEQLVAYHVIEVEYKVAQVETDVLSVLQTFSFSLAFVMFAILMLILITYYFSVSSYKRQLRAANAAYGAGEAKKEQHAPNTNLYSEKISPAYNLQVPEEKEMPKDADEEGKELYEAPKPVDIEVQEVELSLEEELEHDYNEIESGDGMRKKPDLLDNLLSGIEKQGGLLNFGLDADEDDNNMYISEV